MHLEAIAKISSASRIGFWLAGKHPKKIITTGTVAGAGFGYTALDEHLGLLSLAVGAGVGLFITLVIGGLIRCSIPPPQWKTMEGANLFRKR